MKANVILKFIEDCEFQDATIHYKSDLQLFNIPGILDVGSSSQLIYLDAGHVDEDNKPMNGEDIVRILGELEKYSVKILVTKGYYPNIKNKVFNIEQIRVDFLDDGSRQIHLLS